MLLRCMPLRFRAGKPIVILSVEDAQDLDVKPSDRVQLEFKRRKTTAIVNISDGFKPGVFGLYERTSKELKVTEGDKIKVSRSERPSSLVFIKKKLDNNTLSRTELERIVLDTAAQRLSDIEMAAFVIGLHTHGLSLEEAKNMSEVMAKSGDQLKFGSKAVFDKHSIGGCPGDKTSMMLVPIIASAGMTIPKTSSRSITSPAGTADKVECICPVDLSVQDIKRVVNKTNGCLAWGGAVNLSPADDLFIKVEYPLSIDPLLLPSVMSKKKAVGAKYLVIDIPTGMGDKIRSPADAQELAYKFIQLGREMGIKVNCVSSYGGQPIGYGIGPALEAKEALATMSRTTNKVPWDLMGKVFHIAGHLMAFKGIKDGEDKALHLWKSGKAEKKFREIIAAQGGDPKIKPSDIPVGEHKICIASAKNGSVRWIDNKAIIQIAREAGAPKDKGAGILLHKKINSSVKKGETLFEIYAEQGYKLNRALKMAKASDTFGVGDKNEMVYKDIPKDKEEKYFILER